MTSPVVVIGIGNRYRRDDGSALKVLEDLSGRVPDSTSLVESDGEPTHVIDSWDGAALAVIVETVRRGDAPGTVMAIEWDLRQSPPAPHRGEHGSHSLGIVEAIELGRAIERVPDRLRLVGIEPLDVGWGEGLSDPVARGVDGAARLVLDYLRSEGTR
ncbi:MAG: hydrogenase maturation protease [Candidatus Dormiibacterota bacterium]